MLDIYTKVKLKDGRDGVVVDVLGDDYIVDVGSSPDDWDTIMARSGDLEPTEQ